VVDVGTGPAWKHACPCLRDGDERPRRIIGVTEAVSVVEGSPPIREETRRGIAEQLMAIDRNPPARLPAE
jgi:hypothetical protein